MAMHVEPQRLGMPLRLEEEPILRPPIRIANGVGRNMMVIPQETRIQYFQRIASYFASSVIGTFCVTLEHIGSYFDGWLQWNPLPNFAEVFPHNMTVRQRTYHRSYLFRGGNPLASGFSTLRERGVRTVINLRVVDSGRRHAEANGLEYHHIPMNPNQPRDEDVILFLKIMNRIRNRPIFIYCNFGADRTGFMIAAYRIAYEGIDPETAIRELTEGPHGFNKYLHWPLIRYLREMDPEYILQQACLQA